MEFIAILFVVIGLLLGFLLITKEDKQDKDFKNWHTIDLIGNALKKGNPEMRIQGFGALEEIVIYNKYDQETKQNFNLLMQHLGLEIEEGKRIVKVKKETN